MLHKCVFKWKRKGKDDKDMFSRLCDQRYGYEMKRKINKYWR